jgi:osmotically-inducible protein OsmY
VDGVKEVINLLRIAPQPIRDDLSLKEHIRAALTRNPRIDDSRVSVEVVNGRVYLKGSVNTAVEKRLAEDEVWATPGVRDILNQLEILSGAGKSESEIVSEIKEGLSDCLGLDISKISVELQGSVAYLRGIVPNDYLRAAAEELVRWTPPVTDVVNELKVLCWTSPRGRSRLVTLKSPPGSRSPHMERSEMVTTGTGKPA